MYKTVGLTFFKKNAKEIVDELSLIKIKMLLQLILLILIEIEYMNLKLFFFVEV